MKLSPGARKALLSAHITASVGWAGALAVFLAHAVAGQASTDPHVIRAAALAMAVSAWFVILPLSIGALVTGVVQALGTSWGLLRHYWVMFKLALTLLATGVLLMKLGPISAFAAAAAKEPFAPGDLSGLRVSLLVHAVGGLVILLIVIVLAVFKPAGVTPWSAGSRVESIAGVFKEAPRWARASMLALAAIALVLLLMLAAGNHGPSAHLR